MMHNNNTELQAVLLAGGDGLRLYPLASDHSPKATLPIANNPMIHYSLSYLERNGLKDVIVVVKAAQQKIIEQAIEEYPGKLNIDIKTLDNKDCESAEALRQIHDSIYTNFVVMSVDTFTDVPLVNVYDIHRQHNSSLTLLLKDESNINSKEDKSDYFALTNYKRENPSEPTRKRRDLLSKKPSRVIMNRIIDSDDADDSSEEHLSIPRSFLKRWTNFSISKFLKDSHLYIFSKWVIDLLVQKPEIHSIKSDLIPFLIDSQKVPSDKLDPILSTVVPSFPLSEAYRMSTSESELSDLIRVFAHVVPPHEDKPTTTTSSTKTPTRQGVFCKRCNDVPSYLHVNRELARKNNIDFYSEMVQSKHVTPLADLVLLGPDCVIGEGLSVAKKSSKPTIKKSNIGKNCSLGNGALIDNSVIMGNVIIEDKVHLKDCVVSSGCVIEAGTKMERCKVAPNFTVKKDDETYTDQDIMADEMEI